MQGTKAKTSSANNPSGKLEATSTIQAPRTNTPVTGIKILHQGTCPKMTTRGRGDLSYELGINETTGDSYVRISANVSSGAFSHEWLTLAEIRSLLDTKTELQKPFSAITMEPMFKRRSANNHGYLAAVLISEGVLVVLPGKPVMLSVGKWEPIFEKISVLKEKGISLPDHIAIAAQENMKKKALLMSNLRSAKASKSTEKPTLIDTQDDSISDAQDSLEE